MVRNLLRSILSFGLALSLMPIAGPGRADMRILLIGIDVYNSPSIPCLGGASADARSLQKTFMTAAGVPADANHFFVLTSDGDPKPTRENILSGLHWLALVCHSGDTAVVAYSGHGVEGEDGSTYLLPWDVNARSSEELSRTAIKTSFVTSILSNIPAKALLCAFDMCRSFARWGARDIAGDNRLSEQMTRDIVFSPTSRGDGPQAVVTLFACKPRQRSWERRATPRRGVFSYYLERGLLHEAADAHGDVHIADLIPYLERAVYSAVQQEWGEEQTPFAETRGVGALELVLAIRFRSSIWVNSTIRRRRILSGPRGCFAERWRWILTTHGL